MWSGRPSYVTRSAKDVLGSVMEHSNQLAINHIPREVARGESRWASNFKRGWQVRVEPSLRRCAYTSFLDHEWLDLRSLRELEDELEPSVWTSPLCWLASIQPVPRQGLWCFTGVFMFSL